MALDLAKPTRRQDCGPFPESKTDIQSQHDRPGSDYTSFEMDELRAILCANACAQDGNCRAYAYVLPGVQGPKAVCWLKDAVPDAVFNPDVISGRVFR